jgi:hypothetical protein
MKNKKEIEENRKTITIGEAVDKKVKESLDTYKYLKNCDDKELVRMAYDLALHDIMCEKIISRMAYDRLVEELGVKK